MNDDLHLKGCYVTVAMVESLQEQYNITADDLNWNDIWRRYLKLLKEQKKVETLELYLN